MTSLFAFFPVAAVSGVAFAFRQSNFAGKVIVIVLIAGSILAWSLMVTKWKELHQARKRSGRFLNAYRRESHPASIHLKRQSYDGSPVYAIYHSACLALATALECGDNPDDLFMGTTAPRQKKLSEAQIASVRNVIERTLNDEVFRMESGMGMLATATTAAPFLGLLGTVWGVMESFSVMLVAGSAMLKAVAPGISGALLTTVVGLLVALPSAIGYNALNDQIRRLSLDMQNFARELICDLERHYLLFDG